jgi:hypothetical protein
MNVWAALGFTSMMGLLYAWQQFPEWKRRYIWWRLPEAEKKRTIEEGLRLVCRPSFTYRFYQDLHRALEK